MRFLGREGELLDGEVEPDRERERAEDAADAPREKRAAAGLSGHVERVARQIEVGDGADVEDGEDAEREEGDDDREPKRQLHAVDVEADEQRVGAGPPYGGEAVRRAEDGSEVAADAGDNDRGREDVLHVLGEAGDVAAPGAHRGAGERVGAAGMRQRGLISAML